MSNMFRLTIASACLAVAALTAPSATAEQRQIMPENGTYNSPDGDSIDVVVRHGRRDSIRVCLAVAGNITWWKSVEIYGNTGWPLGRIETQDNNRGPNCTDLATAQFDPNNSRILLLKAKGFGAHTGIVSFVFRPSDYDGRSINLMWNKD
ncbi:MAG: hypothetical protein GC190_07175 [Alphaproteobacteria bacterium]|nr:hypothetical protein [Alphaproteobacteria bacterium]